jgi:hypothetical protein
MRRSATCRSSGRCLERHASQQLVQPVLTTPPFAVQWSASFLILHFVSAFFVMQQVTNPGLPHVERAAHLLTAPLQFLGRFSSSACSFATPATHFTNEP